MRKHKNLIDADDLILRIYARVHYTVQRYCFHRMYNGENYDDVQKMALAMTARQTDLILRGISVTEICVTPEIKIPYIFMEKKTARRFLTTGAGAVRTVEEYIKHVYGRGVQFERIKKVEELEPGTKTLAEKFEETLNYKDWVK